MNASENRKGGLPVGTDLGGIRDIEGIRQRCRIDDETGCWHWGLATAENAAPSLWIPALRRRMSLGAAIGFLTTGVEQKGQIWHLTCTTRCCANPKHRVKGTKSSQMKGVSALSDPVIRARIKRTARANSHLTDADCEAIRNDTRRLADIAAQYDIHVSYASLIRRGLARAPLAAANASAFHWRPAA